MFFAWVKLNYPVFFELENELKRKLKDINIDIGVHVSLEEVIVVLLFGVKKNPYP